MSPRELEQKLQVIEDLLRDIIHEQDADAALRELQAEHAEDIENSRVIPLGHEGEY